MKLKSAPLNLILEANGLPTGDQLLKQRLEEEAAAKEVRAAEREAWFRESRRPKYDLPVPLTNQQRRQMEKMYKKQGMVAPWKQEESQQQEAA